MLQQLRVYICICSSTVQHNGDSSRRPQLHQTWHLVLTLTSAADELLSLGQNQSLAAGDAQSGLTSALNNILWSLCCSHALMESNDLLAA